MSLQIEKIKDLLIQIVENKIDLVLAMKMTRRLYYENDEKIIPTSLGVFYDSEFDGLPTPDRYHLWDKYALKKHLETVDYYREDIIADAKALLENLNK